MKWEAEHDKQRKKEWWREREGETETGIEKDRGTPNHAFTHLSSSFQDYQLQIVLLMLLCWSDTVHLSKTEHHPVPLTTPTAHTHKHTSCTPSLYLLKNDHPRPWPYCLRFKHQFIGPWVGVGGFMPFRLNRFRIDLKCASVRCDSLWHRIWDI